MGNQCGVCDKMEPSQYIFSEDYKERLGASGLQLNNSTNKQHNTQIYRNDCTLKTDHTESNITPMPPTKLSLSSMYVCASVPRHEDFMKKLYHMPPQSQARVHFTAAKKVPVNEYTQQTIPKQQTITLGEVSIKYVDENDVQIIWLNGQKLYRGQTKNMIPHGFGTMRWKNGDYYQGTWEDGYMHGRGKYRWANGDIYEGEYKRGIRCGRGNYIHQETQYIGDWKEGRPHGHGQLFHPHRGSVECRWRDGMPALDSSRSSHLSTSLRMMTVEEERIEQ